MAFLNMRGWCIGLALAMVPLSAFAGFAEEEVNCLALNIYHEARGEPRIGQLAVAYVTMNRVVSDRYPNTVCGVVWQRHQFSWTHDGRSDRPREQRAWQRALAIAQHIYSNYHVFRAIANGATDITQGALYYYAPKHVYPQWAAHKETTAQIGSHVFLRDKDEKGLN